MCTKNFLSNQPSPYKLCRYSLSWLLAFPAVFFRLYLRRYLPPPLLSSMYLLTYLPIFLRLNLYQVFSKQLVLGVLIPCSVSHILTRPRIAYSLNRLRATRGKTTVYLVVFCLFHCLSKTVFLQIIFAGLLLTVCLTLANGSPLAPPQAVGGTPVEAFPAEAGDTGELLGAEESRWHHGHHGHHGGHHGWGHGGHHGWGHHGGYYRGHGWHRG